MIKSEPFKDQVSTLTNPFYDQVSTLINPFYDQVSNLVKPQNREMGADSECLVIRVELSRELVQYS